MKKPDMQSISNMGSNMTLSNLLGLYALIAIVVAGVVGYFLVVPQFQSARETADQVEFVRAEIDQLNQLIQDTETLRTNYDEIKQDRDRILGLLPQSDNEEEYLLTLLADTASRNGLAMTSFQAQGGALSSGQGSISYQTYRAEITISGKYQQIRSFIKEVESSSRFLFITEVSASGNRNAQGDNPDISATILMEAFFQSGNPGLSSEAGAANTSADQGGGAP
jgi:Tfp pilus assembly protein PilO